MTDSEILTELARIFARVTESGGDSMVFIAEVRATLGGAQYWIPVASKADRDAKILADRRAVDTVARANGVHPNTVRNVRRRYKRDSQGFGGPEWNL